MRVLLINPNTSTHITERMLETARQAVQGRAEVSAVTAAFGPNVIGSRTESTIAAHAALDLAATHGDAADAIVLGVSLDSGLIALRELLGKPVTAITEAGLMNACMLGQRVGLLTVGATALPMYRELVASYGLLQRLSALRAVESPAAFDAGRDDASIDAALVQAIGAMVLEDAVDSVLLSGAVLAGSAARIRDAVPIPVVDGVSAAALQALTLAGLACRAPVAGSLRAPRARGSRGLSTALQSRLGRD